MASSKLKAGLKLVLAAAAASLLSAFPAHAAESGVTSVHGYVEFTYFDDRGIGWSGSETTFRPRAKIDLRHQLYNDIDLRLAAAWTAQVHEYSRAYGKLYQREGKPEDIYIRFQRFSGYPFDVRAGIVKVPYGIFNTLAADDRNRPLTLTRFREWDMGLRLDAPLEFMDFSLALVNGDGVMGTDANSSKSVVLRAAYPAAQGELYPETEEVTAYPNPLAANPDGAFRWQAGASAWVGDHYTTPIKQKFAHYGADLQAAWGPFALKAEYTFFEGDFNNRDVLNLTPAQWDALVAEYQYTDAVQQNIYTYQRGQSVWAELAYAATERSMLTVMAETYDPDTTSNATVFQKAKARYVIGMKHDYRKGVTAALFYTFNDNPAFGYANVDVTQSDYWKGDNVLMITLAAQF